MIDNRTPDSPRPRNKREGFALPMTILVIAFLTVTIAAAYAATTSELTTNLAQRGESRAYMIAQAGLENFMARRNEMVAGVPFCALCGAPPVTTYESTTVVLPGGKAYVVAQQVRTATDTRPAIYLLRSRGVDTVSIISGSSLRSGVDAARAERTVAMLVYWNVNQVNVLSGWTSTSGLDKNGSAGSISGVDACPPGLGGGKASVAGIAVPTGTYDFSGNSSFSPTGDPAVKELGSQTQTNASVKIDWSGIILGNRIQADYTFPNSATANANWPAAAMLNPNYWPVIRVNGDLAMPSTGGQGTLIVMGDLTMSGDNLWHGILLVGGKMTSNGNGTVNGATESGLNTLLSDTEINAAQAMSSSTLSNHPGQAVANGTKSFQYNSCDVAKAAGGLASYSVYSNAWMDNFVTY